MSKQGKANRLFVETATHKFLESNNLVTISEFCMWLVNSSVITETQLNNWLAVDLYKKELERTKTKISARGVKWIAINRTLERVPISRTKLYNLLKTKAEKADNTDL